MSMSKIWVEPTLFPTLDSDFSGEEMVYMRHSKQQEAQAPWPPPREDAVSTKVLPPQPTSPLALTVTSVSDSQFSAPTFRQQTWRTSPLPPSLSPTYVPLLSLPHFPPLSSSDRRWSPAFPLSGTFLERVLLPGHTGQVPPAREPPPGYASQASSRILHPSGPCPGWVHSCVTSHSRILSDSLLTGTDRCSAWLGPTLPSGLSFYPLPVDCLPSIHSQHLPFPNLPHNRPLFSMPQFYIST